MSFEQSEAERGLANLIRIGTVEDADYENALVRVRSGRQLTGWLPWWTGRAGKDIDWNAPDLNEQVLVLSPDGNFGLGIVLTGGYSAASPPPLPAPERSPEIQKVRFKDGTEITHDREKHIFTLKMCPESTLNVECTHAFVKAQDVTVEAKDVLVKAEKIDLGDTGGPKVARIGDRVHVESGSSAGLWKIVEGSDITRST